MVGGDDISTEAILVSACLRTPFQTVEIDDPRTGQREASRDGAPREPFAAGVAVGAARPAPAPAAGPL